MLEQSDAAFPATRWSLIEAIVSADSTRRADALQTLAKVYWPAVYAFVRKKGKNADDAVELTQAFFSEVVLGRHLFEQADADRGLLRSLILAALKRFMIDQHRRSCAQPVTRYLPSIETLERELGPDENNAVDPEAIFDRRWALAVLEEGLRRCEQHFVSTGRGRQWQAFEMRVLAPAMTMRKPPHHAEIAKAVGLTTSEDSVAAVLAVRKRLLAFLHQVVAETTQDSAGQKTEYDTVVSMLA